MGRAVGGGRGRAVRGQLPRGASGRLQQIGVRIDGEEHTKHVNPTDVPDRVHAAHAQPHTLVIQQVECAEAQQSRLGGRHGVRREE